MIKILATVVDNVEKTRNYLVALASSARHADADLAITMLTAAPMLAPALAPFGGLYLPESELRHDSYDDMVALRAVLGGDDPRIRVGGFYGDIGWLAHELRNSEAIVDLIAIGSVETWDVPWLRRHVIETLLMASGTPLMLLPGGGTLPPIRRAVLAWKSSAEAVRAARDLMAVAEPGAHIDIVTVTADASEPPESRCGISDYLTLHGFEAECHFISGRDSIARELERFAVHHDADLLAIGAYAHSRIREILLGGVTHELLEATRLPVLMAR